MIKINQFGLLHTPTLQETSPQSSSNSQYNGNDT